MTETALFKRTIEPIACRRWPPILSASSPMYIGFLIRHGGARGPMSRKFYNEIKEAEIGPRETVIPGAGKIIISRRAEAEWDRARENPTDTEQRLIAKATATRQTPTIG